MEKQTEDRLTNVGRLEEGEGEMYGESNMETYITICKIDSQWEFAVWLRKLKHRLSVNLGASLVAQRVKHLPTMQETWV